MTPSGFIWEAYSFTFGNAPSDLLKDIATGVLITCLILAVSMLIPIVGFFCSLLLPLPTLYYRIKLGRRTGILVPIIGLVMLVVMMRTAPLDMVFVAALLIMGFSLGELLGSQLSIEKIIRVVNVIGFFDIWANFPKLETNFE